jgi:hypothetical protein
MSAQRAMTLVALVGLSACLGSAGGAGEDAGLPDSGSQATMDAGAGDGGAADAGAPDAGPVDAGLADAGTPDAGPAAFTTCAAMGLTSLTVEIPYPLTANSPRVFTPQLGAFGDNAAVVVQFRTPPNPDFSSALQLSEYSSFPAAFRVATLATVPCVIATAPNAGSPVIGSIVSQGPLFHLSVGPGGVASSIRLEPDAVYYVTYVNRNGYGSDASCGVPSCGAYIDFNN